MPTDPGTIKPLGFVLARTVGLPWRRHTAYSEIALYFLTAEAQRLYDTSGSFRSDVNGKILEWVSDQRPKIVAILNPFEKRVMRMNPDSEKDIREIIAELRDVEISIKIKVLEALTENAKKLLAELQSDMLAN